MTHSFCVLEHSISPPMGRRNIRSQLAPGAILHLQIYAMIHWYRRRRYCPLVEKQELKATFIRTGVLVLLSKELEYTKLNDEIKPEGRRHEEKAVRLAREQGKTVQVR